MLGYRLASSYLAFPPSLLVRSLMPLKCAVSPLFVVAHVMYWEFPVDLEIRKPSLTMTQHQQTSFSLLCSALWALWAPCSLGPRPARRLMWHRQMDFIKLPSPLKVSSSCSGRLDPGSRCYGFQRCRFWPLGHAPEGIQSLREIPETEPRREPRFSPWECQLPSIVLTWLPARASLEHTVLQQQGWYFWSVFCVLDIILTTLPIHAFVVGFTKTCLLAPTDYINSLPTSHCKL